MTGMLDKNKIRLMTRMSIYEKNHGETDFRISSYYRKDYASLKTWITLIWVTIGYGILFGGVCFYISDSLIGNLTLFKFFALLLVGVVGYIALLIVYRVGAGSYYKKRHARAKQNVKRYYRCLSRLEKMYEKEKNGQ